MTTNQNTEPEPSAQGRVCPQCNVDFCDCLVPADQLEGEVAVPCNHMGSPEGGQCICWKLTSEEKKQYRYPGDQPPEAGGAVIECPTCEGIGSIDGEET